MGANEKQVGGSHYKKNAIQPWDYVTSNGLGYLEGCIIKYVSRYKDKGGIEDLKKAQHFLEKLIEVTTNEHNANPVYAPNTVYDPKPYTGVVPKQVDYTSWPAGVNGIPSFSDARDWEHVQRDRERSYRDGLNSWGDLTKIQQDWVAKQAFEEAHGRGQAGPV
jgi:hypothetical protein